MALITLVRPPTVVARWAHTTPTCPPIGVAYVASSLQQAGHRVEVIDAVGEDVFRMVPVPEDDRFLAHGLSIDDVANRLNPATEFIGVSCAFSHEWPITREVIRRLRRELPGVPIVAGGEHITAMPEFSLSDCEALDYCVLGEGEETMVALVNALTSGQSASASIAAGPSPCSPAGAVRTNARSAPIP
jgi:anaerobic magnesium-protoporphyrin IX monomethyl ester cyclase